MQFQKKRNTKMVQNQPAWSYVLKLADGCFYIGATKNYDYRISQHFDHNGGSKWCNMHTPLEVIYFKKFSSYGAAFNDEKRQTVNYMREHGIRHVRGADALNCRADCYTPNSIQFWVPSSLRKDALAGLLGKIDTPLG
jgi:predicted GIY-YIG superfamily endonuclease